MDKARILSLYDMTPLNPAFNKDPYGMLAELRESRPVYRDTRAGTFILSRYADVRGVLSDNTMWRHPSHAEEDALVHRALLIRPPSDDPVLDQERVATILYLEEPDHSRVRAPLAKALYKRVARSRPLVQQIVDEWLDRIGGRTPFDAVDEFALKVPVDVIARILGVDNSLLDDFRDWSEALILSFNPLRSAEENARMRKGGANLSACMHALIAARRAKPEDDLVSDMVAAQAEGAQITDIELSSNFQALMVGGNLTTTDLIGNAIWLLLTHPEELAKLRADPSLINSAVEEALRFESPVDVTSRIASRDMALGGCPIKQGQVMYAALRAANWDPEVFREPARFDVCRKDAPHISFGGGAHVCIGAPLGRLEAQVALQSFFERYPGIRLAEPGKEPDWRIFPLFRGLKSLMVAR